MVKRIEIKGGEYGYDGDKVRLMYNNYEGYLKFLDNNCMIVGEDGGVVLPNISVINAKKEIELLERKPKLI